VATSALAALVVAGLGAAGALPAVAAAQTITASGGSCGGSFGWTNGTQTIQAGETVTWLDCGSGTGNHSVESTSPGWCLADGMTTSSPWTTPYRCTFTTPGTYTFDCGVHHSAMTGAITVTGSQPASPSPRPTPSHAPAPPPARPMSRPTPVPSAPPSRAPVALTSPSLAPVPSAAAASPSPPAAPSASPAGGPPPPGSGLGLTPWLVAVAVAVVLGAAGLYLHRRLGTGSP
jgi:plastocyanin